MPRFLLVSALPAWMQVLRLCLELITCKLATNSQLLGTQTCLDSFKTYDIDNDNISVIARFVFIYLKIKGLYVLFAYPLSRVQVKYQTFAIGNH